MSRKSLVPIQLPADPTNALEAATKQYVDGRVTLTVELTQAAYDALGTKDPNTMYVITDGADRTLLTGTGAPAAGTGINGDFYINTTSWLIYGPKAAGAWPSGVSIIGPAGTITDGDKGDIVVSASGATWMLDSGVVTTAAKTVLDDTTVAAMRTTLGAVNNAGDVMTGDLTAQVITALAYLASKATLPSIYLLNASGTPYGVIQATSQGFWFDIGGDSNYEFSVTTTSVSSSVPIQLPGDPTGATYASTKQYVDNNAGSSGAFFKFTWSSTTSAPPATSGVRYNNATAASVTNIYVSYTSKDGTDIKTRLLVGQAGDRLYVQQKTNSAKYQIYVLSGAPTDNSTYATIPVTYQSGGTALANNDEILIGFIEAPASETYPGIVELATATETDTGTDNTRAVHTAGAAATYVPKFSASASHINAQVGTSYTLVLSDAEKLITLTNASAITLNVPTDAAVAFPVGVQIHLLQLGAGIVTVVGAGPPTVNATPSKVFRTQYSMATLIKYAANTWILVGDT